MQWNAWFWKCNPNTCRSSTSRLLLYQCCCTSIAAPVLLYQWCSTSIAIPALLYQYCPTSVAVPVLLYQYCCTGIAVPVLLYQHCSTSVAVSVLLYQYCCTQLTLLHSPNNLSHVLYLSYFVTCPSYFVFWLRCFVFALFLPLSPPVFGRSTGVRRWRPWLSDLLPTGLKSFPRVA